MSTSTMETIGQAVPFGKGVRNYYEIGCQAIGARFPAIHYTLLFCRGVAVQEKVRLASDGLERQHGAVLTIF